MAADWIFPLISLSAMEIVLGIDNVIFIAILVGRLPGEQQPSARRLGLGLALITRLLLLFTLTWILSLSNPLFKVTGLGIPADWMSADANEVSIRDLILFAGGLFLIAKSTYEIHDKLEGSEEKPVIQLANRFAWILAQIAILDIVFSLDSVITAVGMARPDQLWVMVTAMIIAVGVMLLFAGPIGDFVLRHPTVKMLALSFLILIGVMLIADAVGKHIERGYIYFAMGFSLLVELLNLRVRAPGHPVALNEPPSPK